VLIAAAHENKLWQLRLPTDGVTSDWRVVADGVGALHHRGLVELLWQPDGARLIDDPIRLSVPEALEIVGREEH
jgi:hypothetical protein